MTDPLKQSLRDGRYAVTRVLGEGAQAATFEAVDKRHGALVAIKRFRVRGASSWKEVELAEREARVLASLSESGAASRGTSGAAFSTSGAPSRPSMPSNLPRYIEHFEEDGELYLVTELIEGESLLALRKRGALLTESDIVRLLNDASVALDFLHGRSPPVIHRDIKPSNVLRRPDGSFAFIDFGSVRDRLKPEGGSTVVGTFGYMAPEQFQGRAMPASDVYALGATALSMLTGVEPEKLPHKGLAIDVPAALRRTRVSAAMVSTLSAMLDPDPDTRAARIKPLLASHRRPSAPPRAEPARPGESRREPTSRSKHDAKRDAKHEERRARRDGKREARRAEEDARRADREARRAIQMERWSSRRHRPPTFPAPLIPLFLIGLTVAQVAVTLALGVFVPVMFSILSIVFGKSWRQAGETTRSAGKIAVEAIGRAKDLVSGVPRADAGIGVRVQADAPREEERAEARRVRVGDVTEPYEDADAERAAEELEAEREVAEAELAARDAEREKKTSRDRRR